MRNPLSPKIAMSYLFQRKGTWYIRYTENGRDVRKSLQTTNRREAEILSKKIEAGLTLEKLGLRDFKEPERIRLSDFISEYISYAETNKRPSTVLIDKRVLNQFLAFVGNVALAQIHPRQIERWKADRLLTIKPTTTRSELSKLKAAFEAARKWGYLKENPCMNVTPVPRGPEKRLRFLSVDEIRQLRAVITHRNLRYMVDFYLHTGCRLQEIVYLEWADIDLETRQIHIRPKRIDSKQDFRPKSGKSRTIPIASPLVDIIHSIEKKGRWTFMTTQNTHYSPDTVRVMFKRAIKKAGLDPSYSIHTLRHTFASHLAQQGVSLFIIGQLLGHSSPTMTTIYAHLAPKTFEEVVKRLPY